MLEICGKKYFFSNYGCGECFQINRIDVKHNMLSTFQMTDDIYRLYIRTDSSFLLVTACVMALM